MIFILSINLYLLIFSMPEPLESIEFLVNYLSTDIILTLKVLQTTC